MKKVLVVDDQIGIRLLLAEVLRGMGVNVFDVSSGEQAIKLCLSWEPDLVILDMKMPGMSGVETLRHIRKKLHSDVPVMIMTAYSEVDMVEAAIRLGIRKQIMKPFDIFAVGQDIVEEVCKRPSLCG